ncbi:lactonase family protein [Loigolactobacillus jiayinensis]|uniref:Lactonase family protein n=1 Tax=Loigolactobacillus jiayinensis TaxID=2486016 RepID=A0ABW1RDY3_9LACO|nr:lactonase family protein [Loigolactobacillus jiayinensis]
MTLQLLFGSYTRNAGTGIYQATLNTETKQLTQPTAYITAGNPTYLTVSQAKRLYSVLAEPDAGGLVAYDLTDFNAPKFLNKSVQPGSSPAYVAVDETRQLVYSAKYHSGQLLIHRILPDGSLELATTVTDHGHGPKPEQDGAHVHFADLTPDQRLVTCDLGTDEVHTYDVATDGQVSEVALYQTIAGFGPRHIVFHPTAPVAYLAGELGSAIEVLHYDATTGQFSHLQTIPTIPADFTAHNGAAAIRISSDGRFLYVSNRGHNSLAVFTIEADQTLKLQQLISTEGEFPRDFALDPSESFLVCANQNTSNLTLFARDEQTGQLSLLQKNIACTEPVCVKFL